MSLADQRCRSALNKLESQLEELHFRAFGPKLSPGEEFWRTFLEIDQKLSKRLAARPLGQMEVDAACKVAYTSYNTACKEERARQGIKELFRPAPPPLKLEPIDSPPWQS